MKCIFIHISIFVTLGLIDCYPQDHRKIFYDRNGAETDSANSLYYSVWNDRPDPGSGLSYYTNTQTLRLKSQKTDLGKWLRTYYYPNGSVKSTGIFEFAYPAGLLKSYYPDGSQQSELIFVGDSTSIENQALKIVNYWDSLGNKVIDNGSGNCICNLNPFSDEVLMESGWVVDSLKHGVWLGVSVENHATFREKYDRGKLILGEQNCDGRTYTYQTFHKSATPVGGLKSFYRHVGVVMEYPRSARRMGIHGKVYVEFIVDKQGNLTEAKIVKGIDPECDAEALQAIQSAPAWNPGTHRGRAIRQRKVLPITF